MIALLLSLATAADVNWSFEAEATSDLASAYSGIIAPGDLLTGTITFDVPTDTGGTYQDVVLDAEFTLLGQTWTMLSTGSATVTNGATDHFATGWIFQGPSLTGAGGQTLTPTSINIAVFDSDGTVFDSSVNRGEPATFGVNQVIKGWTEALQLMKEGDKWRLYIPSDLAYGANPRPGGPIEPHSALIFDVQLLSVA